MGTKEKQLEEDYPFSIGPGQDLELLIREWREYKGRLSRLETRGAERQRAERIIAALEKYKTQAAPQRSPDDNRGGVGCSFTTKLEHILSKIPRNC